MAISNKFGSMVVTTGNKSEMSVGYATLYGDMNGGFNPIKDLYKTEVFSALPRCATRWKPDGALGPDGEVDPGATSSSSRRPRNCARTRRTRTRCRPTTCSTRSSSGWSSTRSRSPTIVAAGFDRDTVVKVERLLYLAEYKRRQAAPGVKVTLKNFGRDRRYPIVNRFRDPGAPLPEAGPRAAQARRGEQERGVRFLGCQPPPAGTSVRPNAPCGWGRASTVLRPRLSRSQRRPALRGRRLSESGRGRGGRPARPGSACLAHRRAAATIAGRADRSRRCRPARRWCPRCSSAPATRSRPAACRCSAWSSAVR